MKKLLISFALAVAFVVPVMADPVSMMGTPWTVNNTTSNSPVAYALQYNPTLQQFVVTHGALTATNALQIKIWVNTTGTITNGAQTGTWYPNNTNAATEYILANTYAVTNYVWIQAVTTNSVTVGASYGN